jgi:SulP family sulfate permease
MKLEPKFLTVLKEGYDRRTFLRDLAAGTIVAVVALPLAIAFGISSGVTPEQGLVTAIVAGFLISLLSGSRVQIGGPTGAFVVIVYGVVSRYGYDGLAVATVIAGGLLVLLGLSGLGTVIRFIPYPVTVGFTAGIAIVIAAGQVKDFLGLPMKALPPDLPDQVVAYVEGAGGVNPWAAATGAVTVAILLVWPRISRRVPSPLVALLATTAAVHLAGIPVDTIGSRFGGVSGGIPMPHLPSFSFEMVRNTFSPAISIALLGGIESLLSAMVADGMTGRRHRPNMELVAQGVANLVTPLFGGIPATGAIARTATNVKNGGRTPVAGMIHAAVLLLVLLLFGKWASLIPMATLSGILIVVAWHMGEWGLFRKIFRSTRGDVAVLMATFLLTLLVDLTVAIQVGVVLAAFLFMRRMAEETHIGHLQEIIGEDEETDDPGSVRRLRVPKGVEIFEIEGAFFFGVTDKFKAAVSQVETRPKVLVLRMRKVLALDAAGLAALEGVFERAKREGTVLVLSGVHAQPLVLMERSGLLERIGMENAVENIGDALTRARQIMSTAPVGEVGPTRPETTRGRAAG